MWALEGLIQEGEGIGVGVGSSELEWGLFPMLVKFIYIFKIQYKRYLGKMKILITHKV